MARGVEEGDVAAVGQFDVVRADVLRDAARLARDDVGLADIVEQGGFAVVDVTHHRDDWWTGQQILGTVDLFVAVDLLGDLGGHEFDLVAEFLGHEHEGLRVEALVDGYHQAQAHAGADDLHHRGVVHQGGQVVDGHELGDFQHLVLGQCLLHLFLRTLGGSFALLLAVLGAEVVFLALVHLGVGLLDLLLDLLLELLLLGLGERRLETVAITLAALAGRLLLGLLTLLLLGVLLDVGAGLGHVHLLRPLADALALLGLAVKLAQVDLAHHLEGVAVRLGCRRGSFLDRLRLGLRLDNGLRGFHHRLRFRGLHNGLRLGFRFGLRFRLGGRFRLRFRLRLGFGLRLGLGGRHGLLRLLLDHGLLLLGIILLGVDEGGGLDDGLLFGLLLLGLFAGRAAAALLQDLGDLDLHLVGGLLHLQVLAELLGDGGQVLVGDLGVGVRIHLDTLIVKELHQVVEADVELSE